MNNSFFQRLTKIFGTVRRPPPLSPEERGEKLESLLTGFPEKALELLKEGAIVPATDKNGRNLLTIAIDNYHPEYNNGKKEVIAALVKIAPSMTVWATKAHKDIKPVIKLSLKENPVPSLFKTMQDYHTGHNEDSLEYSKPLRKKLIELIKYTVEYPQDGNALPCIEKAINTLPENNRYKAAKFVLDSLSSDSPLHSKAMELLSPVVGTNGEGFDKYTP